MLLNQSGSPSPKLSPDSVKIFWFEVRTLNFWKPCNDSLLSMEISVLSDSTAFFESQQRPCSYSKLPPSLEVEGLMGSEGQTDLGFYHKGFVKQTL